MANGAFETNTIGGLSGYPNRVRFEWTLLSQNEDGNYSTINWNVRGMGGASGGTYTINFQSRTDVHGSRRQTTGQFNMTNSVFGNENMNIGHDGNGNMSFGASTVNRIYYNTDNASGSGSWGLPGLYQAIGFNDIQFTNITDVGFTVYHAVNRTSNLLQLNINGGGWVTYYNGTYGSLNVNVGGALQSNTTYTVQLRVRRNSNGWVTDSGVYNVTTTAQSRFFDLGDF